MDIKTAIRNLLVAHDEVTRLDAKETWTNRQIYSYKERMVAWRRFHDARLIVEQFLNEPEVEDDATICHNYMVWRNTKNRV